MEQRKFNNLLIFVALFAFMFITFYSKWIQYKKKETESSKEVAQEKTPLGKEGKTVSSEKEKNENKDFVLKVPGKKIASSIDTLTQPNKDCVWSVTIGPIENGRHSYLFLVDGKMINDANNSNVIVSESGNMYSVFEMPNDKSKYPKIDSQKRTATFFYYGEVRNNARLISDMNDWEWSTDEFRPESEKAKGLYEKISTDKSLGNIKGKVVDSNGNPIKSALVMIKPLSEKSPGNRIAKTSENGSFQISYVYPSNYVIVARAKKFSISSPKMIKISEGEKVNSIIVELRYAPDEK